VVSHKWIEGASLHPANAKILIGVTQETTDICADHWNTIELKLQDSCNHKNNNTRLGHIHVKMSTNMSSGFGLQLNALQINRQYFTTSLTIFLPVHPKL